MSERIYPSFRYNIIADQRFGTTSYVMLRIKDNMSYENIK